MYKHYIIILCINLKRIKDNVLVLRESLVVNNMKTKNILTGKENMIQTLNISGNV